MLTLSIFKAAGPFDFEFHAESTGLLWSLAWLGVDALLIYLPILESRDWINKQLLV